MEEMIYQETMNEEMENEAVETDLELVEEDYVEPEESGSIVGKVVVGGVVLVGAAALLFRKKIAKAVENHNIKKLRKKGFVVLEPGQMIEAKVTDAEEVVDDESDECEEVEE